MNPSSVRIGLSVAIVLQVLVLTGMVVKASMPLWTGTEVRVKTVPVDPRSLFRGNYARLNYEFGILPAGALGESSNIRAGEVVYVKLQRLESGLHAYHSTSFDIPEEGVFLRGRISRTYPPYPVKFGIEAFFAPKMKALKLESDLRNGGVAVLMIDDNGRVVLKDVVPNEVAE